MKSVYLVDGLRTPVGSPFRSLKDFTAGPLAGRVVLELARRHPSLGECVDDVVFGNAVMASGGQNPARQAAISGGLPARVPAYTVSNACGAGLQAVILAGQAVLSGHSRLGIAGGTESATHSPQLLSKSIADPLARRDPVDSLIYDGLWCLLTGKHMGELCEMLAREHGISREEQDRYALTGHRKAVAALAGKNFFAETAAINTGAGMFDRDERPRKNVTLENFQMLPPAFADDGTITSGNASVPCDGAAAVIVAGEEAVKQGQWAPMSRLAGWVSIGVEPESVFSAAVPAIECCLSRSGLTIEEIDLFEISEAFAAQAIFTQRKLRIPEEKMNICGSDLALGHPLGAAGARILVTLMHALRRHRKRYGVAAVCLGGGGAVAVAIENLKGNDA